MSVRVAQSSNPSPDGAAAELRTQLGATANSLVVYFASPSYPQPKLAAILHQQLGGRHTIGCSTAGEIVSGSLSKGSIVAMALALDDTAFVGVQLVPRIGDSAALATSLSAFEKELGTPLRDLDVTKYVGLVLMDGLSKGEERFLEALGDRTDLFFVGGSAGDDLKFAETWVSADGVASKNGAVLAILEPTRGFDIIKTQSFTELGKKLVATKVDEPSRVVLEFDGKPAADAYAAAIGTDRAGLADRWMAHPLGLMAGSDPFIRSPAQITENGGVAFLCSMKPGMELSVLASTDIVADTRKALADKVKGGARGLINFNCILRTLDLEKRGQCEAYGEVFRALPTIGFSTYGEAYVGHVNQTATMLLLR
jgi:hypothetical protein